MDEPLHLNLDDPSQEDLNAIITTTCQHYLTAIDHILSPQGSPNLLDQTKDIKNLLDFSQVNFKRVKKLLSYGKDSLNDVEKLQTFRTDINSIQNSRSKTSQEAMQLLDDDVLRSKLPNISPEIASYLLNQGIYNFIHLSAGSQPDYDDPNLEVHQLMDKIIRKKLQTSKLPTEELQFDVTEGVLTATSPIFSFELTLLYDRKSEDYNWVLLMFDHKLQRFENFERKIEQINHEISNIYSENKRDLEAYIIPFIVHKIKYFYSRKRLKSLIKKAELLHTQMERIGSENFTITQNIVNKETIYFEVDYWKRSLIHSLDQNHRSNCLTFQLPNLNIYNFIEQFNKNSSSLFSGLTDDEVTCVYHNPPIPSSDIVNKLKSIVADDSKVFLQTPDMYTKLNEMLLFQVSREVRLEGLDLHSGFYEIFNEIKNILQIFQIITYFCSLYKNLPKIDLPNIFLFTKETGKCLRNNVNIAQIQATIGIEIQEKLLTISTNPDDGSAEFNFDLPITDLSAYKMKFSKIVEQGPYQFSALVIFFKKLLLLHSANKFLLSNSAKFYPTQEQFQDNFRSVTYKSQGIHFTKQDGGYKPVNINFTHFIEFDDNFETASIRTDIKFSYIMAQSAQSQAIERASDQASLVHNSVINLMPFDLKRITKEFGDLITNKKCLAYYGFEINKLESMAGNTTGATLNDMQKFLLKLSPALEQNLTTVDNTVVLTIKPNYDWNDAYNAYLNENEGTKLLFVYPPPPAVPKSKSCEIYERNKITFRYSSVMDTYPQMQKDIEKLESFIRILRFRPNPDIEDDCINKQELHSLTTYTINDYFTFRFFLDRPIEFKPPRYQCFKFYFDMISRKEKDKSFHKKLLLREFKQALPIMELSAEFAERRVDWTLTAPRSGPDGETLTSKDIERSEKILKLMSQMHMNLIISNPWYYTIFWKPDPEQNLFTFFCNFQIINENEHECFKIYYESAITGQCYNLEDNVPFYTYFQKHFERFCQSQPQHQNQQQHPMNGMPNSNGNNNAKPGLKLKFSVKTDIMKFLVQLTHIVNVVSEQLIIQSKKMALSMNANNA